MSRTFHHGRYQKGDRRIYVRGLRRDPDDLRRLARALIAIARAQAEADAKSSAKQGTRRKRAESSPEDGGTK